MSEHTLALEKIGFEQINLPDRTYRWAVIKTFSWTGAPDDSDHLIEALRQHPSFKDHYCAPGEEGVGDEPAPAGSNAAAVESALPPMRDLLRKRGELLFLPYQGKEAEHEWGWVLWHFREWLVIDREGQQLYELACGLD